jgi:hypothetical protein
MTTDPTCKPDTEDTSLIAASADHAKVPSTQEIGRAFRSPYLDDTDHAEAAAIEAATGAQVRDALRPYLDALRDVNPDAASRLTHMTINRYGAEWIAAFRAPTRFGRQGKRWPAALNAEIAGLLNGLCALEEAAYRAHHGIGVKPDATEPA